MTTYVEGGRYVVIRFEYRQKPVFVLYEALRAKPLGQFHTLEEAKQAIAGCPWRGIRTWSNGA